MKLRLQLGGYLLVLGTVIAVPSLAQRPRTNAPSQRQAPAAQQRRQDRPPQRPQERPQPQPERRQGGGAGNPQRGNGNAPDSGPRPNYNPNRPPSAYNPPPVPQRKFNERPPQDQQKLIEDNRKYQNLSPQQRQEMQRRAETWNRLTPTQQTHIRNDILPKWKDMPVERKQAIRQRLQILQNMPESAKNQRLNDPNFTRGMSEEDKATLRDLTHMHVGAPDPPGE